MGNQYKVIGLVLVGLLIVTLFWGIISIKNEGKLTRESVENVSKGMPNNLINDFEATVKDNLNKSLNKITDLANKDDKSDTGTGEKNQEPKQENLVDNVFDLFNKATKTLDEIGQNIVSMTPEEEQKIGREVHKEITKEFKFVDDDSLNKRIKKLSTPLLKMRERKNISYSFFIIKSAEVNAFSILGGFIYINQGLLEFFKSDDELQFVIGHEIAHCDLKHCVKKIAYAAKAKQVGGELASNITQLAYNSISTGYTKKDEFDADIKAYEWLLKNGVTRQKALSGPRRLVILSEKYDQDRKPGQTNPDDFIGKIEKHFESHPSAVERLSRLEKLN